ncbi:LysR family transcriptional regulator [Alkalibacter mobilis]|uniref:LysR family transcriptional regulator n=1 Tax=Alkalibacter mobilis TaxID=2787712 RepID=UPI00189DEEC5|nr:LysR family transcriptional regulator [Alkalibacter mobilis]MBF7097252.1 LysR family transcriptional regulator [Alkalibacter mobilis]
MDRNNLQDVSIYQMQLFIVVAEELNFSRAAEIMNITQPTLSKRISTLENMIDMKLFNRKNRPIELTPSGKILYESWKKICEQFQKSLNESRKLTDNMQSKLRVGWFDSGNMLGPISLVGKQLSRTYENLFFEQSYSSFLEWRSLILNNVIDIMVTIKMEEEHLTKEFSYDTVSVCPKLVCMLDDNPLSQKDKIIYEDLKDQKFVMLPMDISIYHQYINKLCQEHGFIPKVARYAPNPNSLISNLLGDDEIVVCDKYLRDIDNPIIKCFELPNTYSGLIVVWKTGKETEYIREFITLFKKYFEE